MRKWDVVLGAKGGERFNKIWSDMVLRHARGTAHTKSLSKWWGDDNEDIMETGREGKGMCLQSCLTVLLIFIFLFSKPILFFCSEIKLWFSITEAGAKYPSNAISPFAPTPVCAPERVRVMHNILSDLLFNIILNNAMHCPRRLLMGLNIPMLVFLAHCLVILMSFVFIF